VVPSSWRATPDHRAWRERYTPERNLEMLERIYREAQAEI